MDDAHIIPVDDLDPKYQPALSVLDKFLLSSDDGDQYRKGVKPIRVLVLNEPTDAYLDPVIYPMGYPILPSTRLPPFLSDWLTRFKYSTSR